MPGFFPTDAQWAKMEPFCLGNPSHPPAERLNPEEWRDRPFGAQGRGLHESPKTSGNSAEAPSMAPVSR